ncbi:MAG TPA: response regulator [Chloroflexia bacterium]|nr:response regulator [Chloroflexia bacterium]
MIGRVLVVEDELLWLRVLERRLQTAGYTVACAANGRHALTWLATADPLPDVILTDLLMPEIGGYDLSAAIRADARLAHLPIIIMSSLDSAAFREPAAQLGIFRYLTKPLPAEEIVTTIGAALAAQPPTPGSGAAPADNYRRGSP